MGDSLWTLFTAFLEGYLADTGRWVLSLFGWKSNWFVETLLGFIIWIAGVALLIAVLVMFVG
jgi:hypothetical protein